MPSHKSLVTSHESPVKGPNSFRLTYICKNASVNPYGSHISKTKDLKSFRITYFQKNGAEGTPSTGRPAPRIRSHNLPCLLSRRALVTFQFRGRVGYKWGRAGPSVACGDLRVKENNMQAAQAK